MMSPARGSLVYARDDVDGGGLAGMSGSARMWTFLPQKHAGATLSVENGKRCKMALTKDFKDTI